MASKQWPIWIPGSSTPLPSGSGGGVARGGFTGLSKAGQNTPSIVKDLDDNGNYVVYTISE